MRLLVQRCLQAEVIIDNKQVAAIKQGLLIFVGVKAGDGPSEAEYLAAKAAKLRIFEDEQGKMNRSVQEVGGAVLVVSQFTLYGNCKKGNRPSFIEAMEPAGANELYCHLVDCLRALGLTVATGKFGADMQVSLINDGPVTLWLDTASR
ncbi:MAG: D-aminoacyl-tRNA deacylase [Oscillospiraceae bacterium]|nr:D-aminoacyl-tRNA deacylase [Oscillospiraceae bacterium]MDD4368580.1 D-aminoacyl-tRNA deacylase [Oscillospiraceae bacterium]